jgi:hypothetical protein
MVFGYPARAGLAVTNPLGASTILGSRMVKVEPWPSCLSTVMSRERYCFCRLHSGSLSVFHEWVRAVAAAHSAMLGYERQQEPLDGRSIGLWATKMES